MNEWGGQVVLPGTGRQRLFETISPPLHRLYDTSSCFWDGRVGWSEGWNDGMKEESERMNRMTEKMKA